MSQATADTKYVDSSMGLGTRVGGLAAPLRFSPLWRQASSGMLSVVHVFQPPPQFDASAWHGHAGEYKFGRLFFVVNAMRGQR